MMHLKNMISESGIVNSVTFRVLSPNPALTKNLSRKGKSIINSAQDFKPDLAENATSQLNSSPQAAPYHNRYGHDRDPGHAGNKSPPVWTGADEEALWFCNDATRAEYQAGTWRRTSIFAPAKTEAYLQTHHTPIANSHTHEGIRPRA